MQNEIPQRENGESVASRAVERSLEARRAAYAEEIQRLVEATFAVMGRSGSLEPRVEEIVRAAGLSNQAFYRHFRSKEELLLAVLDDGIRQLRDYLQHRVQGVDSPGERIREWLLGMAAQATNREAAQATRPFVVFRGRLLERFPEELKKSEAQLTALLRTALRDAVAQGELPDADPERDPEALYDIAMGWMQRQLTDSKRPTKRDTEHLLAFAMGALGRGT